MTGCWYHRNINGIEAQKLLEEYGQDGSFLIRPSESRNNSFTLSVRCANNAYKHIKIQNNGDFYDIGEGGDKFATLSELVQHFILKETLRDRNDGTMLVLKYPLSYREPTTERYYHGAISGAEAEGLLLEKGIVGSYLVRESRSSPENYVLSVRCESNKIVHLFVKYTKFGYTLQNYDEYCPTLDEFISKLTKRCPIVDSKDNVVYLKQPFNASRMNAMSLASRIKDLEKEQQQQQAKHRQRFTGFAEEFEMLQQQDGRMLYNRIEGEKPENKCKNRFKTILPFDHTRVVLKNNNGSDYINANYIKADDQLDFGKLYIATQGPLPNTVNDFWKMVYIEHCTIILMITHEYEKGRVKCAKYWPDNDSNDYFYDDIKVKCIQQTNCSTDYILRLFMINDTRKVYHFQYLAWSDHSVPENVRNTLDFLEHVNKVYKGEQLTNKCPVVVHCSAGIGRTGAIILIDAIIDKIKHYGLQCDIDVQKTVLHLRTQRSGMVQTEKQYQFLYIALKEHVNMVLSERTRSSSINNNRQLHSTRSSSLISAPYGIDANDQGTRRKSYIDEQKTSAQYMNLFDAEPNRRTKTTTS